MRHFFPHTHVPTCSGVFWSQVFKFWYSILLIFTANIKKNNQVIDSGFFTKTIKSLKLRSPHIETKLHPAILLVLLNNWDWDSWNCQGLTTEPHYCGEDIVLTVSSGFALAVPTRICQWISYGRWAYNEVAWLSHYSSLSVNTTTKRAYTVHVFSLFTLGRLEAWRN